MTGSAIIEGNYRYELTRMWGSALHICTWVMLNPSTADGLKDDPTIRKCVSYAKRWGFGGIKVVNVFAMRATDPAQLTDLSLEEVAGQRNGWYLERAAKHDLMLVCGWGNSVPKPWRQLVDSMLVPMLQRNAGSRLHYLKLNKDGSPAHPLYLSGNLTPKVWLGAHQNGLAL